MNDLESVPRSIKRWLAAVLPGWTVTLEETPTPVADDDRPVAIILATSEVQTLFARRTIPQGDVHRAQTFVATAYPAMTVPDGAGTRLLSVREAAQEARELAQLLDDAVTIGTVNDAGAAGYSYPLTIPLWDWTGVPVTGPGREGPAQPVSQQGAPGVPAVMEVEEHNVRPLADPEDPRRRTVALTLRVSWWTPGRSRLLPAAEPIATDMSGTWEGEP